MKAVTDKNNIPYCPYCKKPTKRRDLGESSTLVEFIPYYDEEGNNTNPDRNTIEKTYECCECNKIYEVEGNDYDGYEYKGVKNESDSI